MASTVVFMSSITCIDLMSKVVLVCYSDSDENGNGPAAQASSSSAESSSGSETDSEDDSDSDSAITQKKSDVKSKPKVTSWSSFCSCNYLHFNLVQG